MLTEWLLIKMLKIPWSQSHSEAHSLEHTVSNKVEEQMRINLGDPKTCPHGNPLPGFEFISSSWVPLEDIAAGNSVIIRRIHELGAKQPRVIEIFRRK